MTDDPECPSCGAISEQIYRCSECGHDLANTDASTASRSDATGGI